MNNFSIDLNTNMDRVISMFVSRKNCDIKDQDFYFKTFDCIVRVFNDVLGIPFIYKTPFYINKNIYITLQTNYASVDEVTAKEITYKRLYDFCKTFLKEELYRNKDMQQITQITYDYLLIHNVVSYLEHEDIEIIEKENKHDMQKIIKVLKKVNKILTKLLKEIEHE